MFDFSLAVERLAVSHSYAHAPVTSEVRAKYPELGFLFDEVDAARYDREKWGTAEDVHEELKIAKDRIEHMGGVLEEAEERAAQLRDMALVLSRMTQPQEHDIKLLAQRADEAQVYFEKQIERGF